MVYHGQISYISTVGGGFRSAIRYSIDYGMSGMSGYSSSDPLDEEDDPDLALGDGSASSVLRAARKALMVSGSEGRKGLPS